MSRFVRKTHRVTSILFTLTVIANFIALGVGKGAQPAPYITYAPLAPLFVLLLTGLYMFVLPYTTKRRGDGASIGADR